MKPFSLVSLATVVFLAASPASASNAEQALDWTGPDQVSIFKTAFERAGLGSLVEEDKPFTLFVPTDFALRLEGTAGLLEGVYATPGNRARLTDLMNYHYVPDEKLDLAWVGAMDVRTQSGEELSIARRDGEVVLNGHIRVTESIDLGHGAIHIVSGLLWADLVYDEREQTAEIPTGTPARN